MNTDILFHIFSFLTEDQLISVRLVCLQWHQIIDSSLLSLGNKSFFSHLYKNHKRLQRFANAKKIKGDILKYQLLGNGFLVVVSYYYDTRAKRYRYLLNCIDHCGMIFSIVFHTTVQKEYSDVSFAYDWQNNGVVIKYETWGSPFAKPLFFCLNNFRFKKMPNSSQIHYIEESVGWFHMYLKGSWYESSTKNKFNNMMVHIARNSDSKKGLLRIYDKGAHLPIMAAFYQTYQNHIFYYGLGYNRNDYLINVDVFEDKLGHQTFVLEQFHIIPCSPTENIIYKPLFYLNHNKIYIAKIVNNKKSKFHFKFLRNDQ